MNLLQFKVKTVRVINFETFSYSRIPANIAKKPFTAGIKRKDMSKTMKLRLGP